MGMFCCSASPTAPPANQRQHCSCHHSASVAPLSPHKAIFTFVIGSSGGCLQASIQRRSWPGVDESGGAMLLCWFSAVVFLLIRSEAADEDDVKAGCSTAANDLVYVLDGSWSVGVSDFDTAKQWLINITSQFDISSHYTQVGVVQYSDAPRLEIPLGRHQGEDELIRAIQSISYLGGNTQTGRAIKFAVDHVFSSTQRASQVKNRIAVVVTDGKSQDDVVDASMEARTQGITVFSVGVGSEITTSELVAIANKPSSTYVLYAEDYTTIHHIRDAMEQKLCEESVCPTRIPVSSRDEKGFELIVGMKLPSKAKKIIGSLTSETAYALAASTDVTAKTREIFPEGLPPSYVFVATVRIKASSSKMTFDLWRVLSKDRKVQAAVTLNGKDKSLTFVTTRATEEQQSVVFQEGFQGLFDGKWHQLKLLVRPPRLSGFLDDGLIGQLSLDPVDPIYINGKVQLSKRPGSDATVPVDVQKLRLYCDPLQSDRETACEIPSVDDVRCPPARVAPAEEDRGCVAGPPGPRGLPGRTGFRGERGREGPPGPDGKPGKDGKPGEAGPRGSPGATGERGPAGPRGEPGSKGAVGDHGEPGLSGQPGPLGPRGDSGERGLPGPPGEAGPLGQQGPPGEAGPKGETGPPGPPGPPGQLEIPKGPQGSPEVIGQDGPKGNCGDPGRPGPAGPPGQKGWKGQPGFPGPPGAMGLPGFKGHQGETGNAGLKGSKGEQGTDGEPGIPGSTGETGPTGRKGEKGVAGEIGPRGTEGRKGDMGHVGSVGPRGFPGQDGLPGHPGAPGHPGKPGKTPSDERLLKLCTDVLHNHLPALLQNVALSARCEHCQSIKGAPGQPGAPGPKGSMGIPGYPGGSGAPGYPGPPGMQGPAGLQGEVGPQGLKGSKGDGYPGPPGPPGQPGASGPRGFDGIGQPGNQGFPGKPGPQGDPGKRGNQGPPGICDISMCYQTYDLGEHYRKGPNM